MALETWDESNEETWPDQQKDKDKDADKDKDNDKDIERTETFDQSDEDTWPYQQKDNDTDKYNEKDKHNDNWRTSSKKISWRLVTFETLITFLTIEYSKLNIHSDPWIKSDRDSIRNSCDVLILALVLCPFTLVLINLVVPAF